MNYRKKIEKNYIYNWSFKEVKGIHEKKTRYAASKPFIQCHIEMDGDMSLYSSHHHSDKVCSTLLLEFPEAEIVIHLELYGYEEKLITVKTSTKFNNIFMEEALKQAQLALDNNEIPVGAIIVNRISNKFISRTHNIVEKTKNSVLHAEIVAINTSCQILSSKNLSDCYIYVTLKPCTMCSVAISFARIGRLFYATNDPKQGAVENGNRFFNSKSCFYRPEIYSGFLAKFSENIIKKCFYKVRK